MKVEAGGQTVFLAGSTEPILRGWLQTFLGMATWKEVQDLPNGHGLGGHDVASWF